jgi:hypothetical protein
MPDKIDLVDVDIVHVESSEAEADVDGKIHESKKELKNAIKESKEQRKIDIR